MSLPNWNGSWRRGRGGVYAAAGHDGQREIRIKWFTDEVAPGLTLTQGRRAGHTWTTITHDGSGLAVLTWYGGVRQVRAWLVEHRAALRELDWTRDAGELLASEQHRAFVEANQPQIPPHEVAGDSPATSTAEAR